MDGSPQPMNAAMEAILARSRQVMTKLGDDTKPSKGRSSQVNESYGNSYSAPVYDERDEREPVYENYDNYASQPNPNVQYLDDGTPFQVAGPIDYDANIVRNSRLPENIKKLMIEHPIKQAQMPSATSNFTPEQIARIRGQMGTSQPTQVHAQAPQQRLHETQRQIPTMVNNGDMITLSKSDLKDMINEGIATFFKQVYDKTLTEETIKKTINVLIKEGKIGVKK